MKKLGSVRHSRHKMESALERGRDIFRRYSLNVKVEIQRNTSARGAGGGFKHLYTAFACPISKGKHMPQNWNLVNAGNARGRRCGEGSGRTPTAAYKDALRSLAKIKR